MKETGTDHDKEIVDMADDVRDSITDTVDHNDLKEVNSITRASAWESGYTLAEILAMDLPAPKWAIEGMVAEGLTILAGPSKVGKSWLSLDMCLSVANGRDVLGFQVVQGETLYLALEDKPRRMQERARDMQAGSGDAEADRVANLTGADKLHIYFDWPRLDKGGFQKLEETLTAHPELRLVVVDTYARVKAPLQANKSQYEQEYRDANRLKRLAEDNGLAIVVVTHTTKLRADADPFLEISGSVGLTAAMDNGIVLRYTGGVGPNGAKGKEMHLRGRDVSDTTLSVWLDEASTRRWQRADLDLFAHLTPDQRQTAKLLFKQVTMTPLELARLMGGGMTADAAQLRLNKLVSIGVAERLRKGVYILTDEYLPGDARSGWAA